MKSWKTLAIMAVLLTLVMSSVVPGAIALSEEKNNLSKKTTPIDDRRVLIPLEFRGAHTLLDDNPLDVSALSIFTSPLADPEAYIGIIAGINPSLGHWEKNRDTLDIYVENVTKGSRIFVGMTGGSMDIYDYRPIPHSEYNVVFYVFRRDDTFVLPIEVGANYTHIPVSLYGGPTFKFPRVKSNCTFEFKVYLEVSSPFINESIYGTINIHINVTGKKVKTPVASAIGRMKSFPNKIPLVKNLLNRGDRSSKKEKVMQNLIYDILQKWQKAFPTMSNMQTVPKSQPVTGPNIDTIPNTQLNPSATPSTTPSTTNSLITKLFETISEQISNAQNNFNSGTTSSTTTEEVQEVQNEAENVESAPVTEEQTIIEEEVNNY